MSDTTGHTPTDTEGRRRLDLKAAAAELGVTSEAIRRRAKRGTLPSEKGEDGLLYVWVPDGPHAVSDDGSHGGPHGVSDGEDPRIPNALLERYEDENDFLRRELERLHRELERKDAILLTLAQRVPELEPAREGSPQATGASQTPSEEEGNGTGRDGETSEPRRSWLARFFGLQ